MLYAKSLITLFPLASGLVPGHAHPAASLVKRQAGPAGNASSSILTSVTPSPGASPIPITKQHQALTTFVPVLTVCPQPALPTAPAVAASNVSSNASCSTSFSPSITTVCYTELPALASKATITSCDQPLTFSERLGYSFSSPSVNTVTTYFVAPWQQLTAAAPPSTSVTARVCSSGSDAATGVVCTDTPVEPQTSVVTNTLTSSNPLKVTAFVRGPAKAILAGSTLDIGSTTTDISTDTQVPTTQLTTSTLVSYAPRGPGLSTAVPGGTNGVQGAVLASDASQPANPQDPTPSQPDYSNIAGVVTSSSPATLSSDLSTSTRTRTVTVTMRSNSTSATGVSGQLRTTTVSSTGTILRSITMTRSPTLASASIKLLGNSTSS